MDPQQKHSVPDDMTKPHSVPAEWNATAVDYPRDKCVHQLVETQVAQTPDAVAILWEGRSLTYGELNQQANLLAQQLRDLDVGPDTLVGVCLERSAWMVIAVLAILKAGGAYVPLDPAFPEDRLKYMIEASRMPVILTQESAAASLPPHQARIVAVDGLQSGYQPMANPTSLAQPENLAYVLFTSGSTGASQGGGNPASGDGQLPDRHARASGVGAH